MKFITMTLVELRREIRGRREGTCLMQRRMIEDAPSGWDARKREGIDRRFGFKAELSAR